MSFWGRKRKRILFSTAPQCKEFGEDGNIQKGWKKLVPYNGSNPSVRCTLRFINTHCKRLKSEGFTVAQTTIADREKIIQSTGKFYFLGLSPSSGYPFIANLSTWWQDTTIIWTYLIWVQPMTNGNWILRWPDTGWQHFIPEHLVWHQRTGDVQPPTIGFNGTTIDHRINDDRQTVELTIGRVYWLIDRAKSKILNLLLQIHLFIGKARRTMRFPAPSRIKGASEMRYSRYRYMPDSIAKKDFVGQKW